MDTSSFNDWLAGAPDAAITMGKNALVQPVAGLAGLGSGAAALVRHLRAGKNLQDAAQAAAREGAQTVEDTQGIAGGPETEKGGRILQGVGDAVDWATTPLQRANDVIGEQSPALAAGLLGVANLVDPTKGIGKAGKIAGRAAKAAGRGLRGDIEAAVNAHSALPTIDPSMLDAPAAAPRAPISEQPALPGMERTLDERHAQTLADMDRLAVQANAESAPPVRQDWWSDNYQPPRPQVSPETQAAYDNARAEHLAAVRDVGRRDASRDAWEPMQALREGRSPTEPLGPSLAREQQLLDLKTTAPIDAGPEVGAVQRTGGYYDAPGVNRYGVSRYDLPREAENAAVDRDMQMRQSRELVRQLREANAAVNPEELPPRQPQWAERMTTPPSSLPTDRPVSRPADEAFWNKALGIDPNAPRRSMIAPPPESVAAFLREVRNQPEMLQFGGMPTGADTLQEFGNVFGERANKPVHVELPEGGSRPNARGYYDDEQYIKDQKTHGRFEPMRDQYGDYMTVDKTHEAGDVPMYDERGDVKKVEVKGPPLEGESAVKIKREAQGGEPMRDQYGDVKSELKKSEGGEPVLDEHGDPVYEKVENPDYNPTPEHGDTYLRSGKSEIKVSGYPGDENETYAMKAGDSGALLYQTLLAHATHQGIPLGGSGLTPDNALRLLSNTLANYARTGENPRNVSGTLAGSGKYKSPLAQGNAPGHELWQALASESDSRIASRGGDPDAIQFTGEGFTAKGQPITPGEIGADIETYSPGVKATKVGPKTVMQNAVYKWLEKASPEQAKEAAKNWAQRIGAPLFGVAGATGLAQALREQAAGADDGAQ